MASRVLRRGLAMAVCALCVAGVAASQGSAPGVLQPAIILPAGHEHLTAVYNGGRAAAAAPVAPVVSAPLVGGPAVASPVAETPINAVDVDEEALESDPFASDATLETADWNEPEELTVAKAEAERNYASAVVAQQTEVMAAAQSSIAARNQFGTLAASTLVRAAPVVMAGKCPGTCKSTASGCAGGTFLKGLCAGAANIQCCKPNAAAAPAVGPVCGGNGRCKTTGSGCAGGTFRAGLCPGASNVQCCIPNAAPAPAPARADPACGRGGRCRATSAGCSGGVFQAGLCNGPANIQCCLPQAPGPVGSCGAYNGAQVSQLKGNNNRFFGVTPIARQHLSNPGTYGANPTTTDNTMLLSTACAFDAMASAARGAGLTLTINSGFRTLQRQQYFWNCYQTGRCNNGNLAARPGNSNHGIGLAVDLHITPAIYRWLSANAHRFGFVRTVPKENWHWEHRVGWKRASYT